MRQDFTTDKTAAIFDYADKAGLIPDFVKQSSFVSAEEVADMPDRIFADQNARLYPCHTKAATLVSAVYAAANQDDTYGVREEIEKRAATFDITEEVKSVFDHFDSTMDKSASVDQVEETVMQKFAHTATINGTEHNFYDISTRADVLLAIDHIDADYKHGYIEPTIMRKVASAVAEQANNFGVGDRLTYEIAKYASKRLPDIDAAQSLMSLRVSQVEDMTPYEACLDKFASALAECESFEQTQEIVDQTAADIYAIDKKAGVKYSMVQPDPYEILLSGPTLEQMQKFASEHVYVQGVAVPTVDFVNMTDDRVDTYFSKSSAAIIKEAKHLLDSNSTAELTKQAADKLTELPADVQLKFLQVLADTGF